MMSQSTGPAMTLYWHEAGPLVRYEGDTLRIDDMNPEFSVCWRMSRWEMLRLGWRCILAAVRADCEWAFTACRDGLARERTDGAVTELRSLRDELLALYGMRGDASHD